LSWNYPAWSISLEFMAYLAFPIILYAFWRAGVARKLLLATALVAALGWLAHLTNNDFNQWDGAKSLLRCLPEFMLGMLLYSTFQSGGTGSGIRHRRSWLTPSRAVARAHAADDRGPACRRPP
jgi:peptidoglycan/LPS O-acetylase OafA/YrhL